MILNLFYEEPEGDRWVLLDRHPRRIVRRMLRGVPQPGGQQRVFLNLCAGLDRIGVTYRINDYDYARKHPAELACIIGKPHVLDKVEWKNPILFGAAVFSHPSDDPNLLERRPVRSILVPGNWMKEMWRPIWDEQIFVWPVGIDVDLWRPVETARKQIDVLLYDKVRWDHDYHEGSLIEPIRRRLREFGKSFHEMRYGFYKEQEFQEALVRCRVMIFLCEHETQGIAYQQALSCGVPILAWDRGGFCQDPALYPHRVKFGPVSSVPYWDSRCGKKFASIGEFDETWTQFWDEFKNQYYDPRSYILEKLTLEKCAEKYVRHARSIK